MILYNHRNFIFKEQIYKKIVLALVLGFCSFALADPTPFGLELNKATFKEVAKKYPSYAQINSSNILKGKDIIVPANKFELEGIKNYVDMSFDNKNILHYLHFDMSKDRFNSILTSLKKKYKLLINTTLPNGNKYAQFDDGNSVVILIVVSSSPDMNVIYATKKYDAIINGKGTNSQNKQQKQDSLL